MVLSAAPVANHSLPGSTATERTQPMCPEITLNSFQGACHAGFGIVGAFLMASWWPCAALCPASGLDLSMAPACSAPPAATPGGL